MIMLGGFFLSPFGEEALLQCFFFIHAIFLELHLVAEKKTEIDF